MTGGSTTVLVVDDDRAIRLLCRVNLELDGHVVLEAGSLAEARALLGEADVDVVLLDLHLGGETGEALIGDCRRARPPIPVAVVTGSADPDAAARAGADLVLSKPFAIEELSATVRSLEAQGAGAR